RVMCTKPSSRLSSEAYFSDSRERLKIRPRPLVWRRCWHKLSRVRASNDHGFAAVTRRDGKAPDRISVLQTRRSRRSGHWPRRECTVLDPLETDDIVPTSAPTPAWNFLVH